MIKSPAYGLGKRPPWVKILFVGHPLWRALQLSAFASLNLLPRAIEAVGIDWPHLTNHFMLLESQ